MVKGEWRSEVERTCCMIGWWKRCRCCGAGQDVMLMQQARLLHAEEVVVEVVMSTVSKITPSCLQTSHQRCSAKKEPLTW